jgi:hypothetical protein
MQGQRHDSRLRPLKTSQLGPKLSHCSAVPRTTSAGRAGADFDRCCCLPVLSIECA